MDTASRQRRILAAVPGVALLLWGVRMIRTAVMRGWGERLGTFIEQRLSSRPAAFGGGVAVTALQFQDMASQLIIHTSKRLRSCADRLARETMGEDEEGEAVAEEAPLRPNPVTQDEMDAGSVELF